MSMFPSMVKISTTVAHRVNHAGPYQKRFNRLKTTGEFILMVLERTISPLTVRVDWRIIKVGEFLLIKVCP